jgi:hypothetical protein
MRIVKRQGLEIKILMEGGRKEVLKLCYTKIPSLSTAEPPFHVL